MKPWAKDFYLSKAWRLCRDRFLLSKNYICERCQDAATIAHHKEYITPLNINNPDITLNWDNLESLCQDCHNKEHHRSESMVGGLCFDDEGNLAKKLDTINDYMDCINISDHI